MFHCHKWQTVLPYSNSVHTQHCEDSDTFSAWLEMGYLSVSITHGTLTWTTGSFTCICDLFACTLLPSVNTLIAWGMFCGAKYTHHTFTPIIKHLITTTANKQQFMLSSKQCLWSLRRIWLWRNLRAGAVVTHPFGDHAQLCFPSLEIAHLYCWQEYQPKSKEPVMTRGFLFAVHRTGQHSMTGKFLIVVRNVLIFTLFQLLMVLYGAYVLYIPASFPQTLP